MCRVRGNVGVTEGPRAMTLCLLCPAPAVADGLCVADGARLWVAEAWLRDEMRMWRMKRRKTEGAREPALYPERWRALDYVPHPINATKFLARLAAAREERRKQTCGRDDCKPCEDGRS